MNDLYYVKHIIVVFFCIISTVACQGKSEPQSKDTMEIETENPNTDPLANANADVLSVRAERENDSSWTFSVTVQHPDTGWEDYADGWDIVLPDGEVIKPDPKSEFTRTLLHPHVDEQPFTRSQSGIYIPSDITIVRVRAHDLVDGFGGEEIIVDLTLDSGLGFEVSKNR